MSLMEVLRMEEFAARIRVQVAAPAREHGLIMPRDEQTSRTVSFAPLLRSNSANSMNGI